MDSHVVGAVEQQHIIPRVLPSPIRETGDVRTSPSLRSLSPAGSPRERRSPFTALVRSFTLKLALRENRRFLCGEREELILGSGTQLRLKLALVQDKISQPLANFRFFHEGQSKCAIEVQRSSRQLQTVGNLWLPKIAILLESELQKVLANATRA